MDKKYTVGLLNTEFNNFIAGVTGFYVLENIDPDLLPNPLPFVNSAKPEPYLKFEITVLKRMLKDEEKRNHLKNEFIRMLIHSFLRNVFETAKKYVNSTKPKQWNKMENAEWYQFARIIRNSLAHEYIFKLNYYTGEKNPVVFPVVWRDKKSLLA